MIRNLHSEMMHLFELMYLGGIIENASLWSVFNIEY